MKALVGVMTLALAVEAQAPFVEPAHACRVFSRWAYPWPQRCPTQVVVKQRQRFVVHRPVSSDVNTIPLPSLAAIEWGRALVDAEALARIELRIKLRGER